MYAKCNALSPEGPRHYNQHTSKNAHLQACWTAAITIVRSSFIPLLALADDLPSLSVFFSAFVPPIPLPRKLVRQPLGFTPTAMRYPPRGPDITINTRAKMRCPPSYFRIEHVRTSRSSHRIAQFPLNVLHYFPQLPMYLHPYLVAVQLGGGSRENLHEAPLGCTARQWHEGGPPGGA